MTLLAVPIYGDSIEQIRRDIETAVERGAELIELRVDLVEGVRDDEIGSLRENRSADVPIILTIRSRAEGGHWQDDDDERISRLIELGPIADYIDAELATWRRSANIRQKLQLALSRAGHISQTGGKEEIARATKRKLILSRHDLTSRPPTLHADLLEMFDVDACRVVKLAWRARTIRDNFEAFELMRQSPRPAIVICMGEEGLLSRILAKKFGAFATFAALGPGRRTAPGQPTLHEMRSLYRWDTINAETHVYGVIGDPVRHSLSPHVHNAAFARTGENAVYVPMRVGGTYEAFKAFVVEVLARPWLGFRGFSVTLPHKEHALRYLQEGGGTVHPTARRAGAVNTLTLAPDGSLVGHNTDCAAVVDAILEQRQVRGTLDVEQAAAGEGGGARPRAKVGDLEKNGASIKLDRSRDEGALDLAGVRVAVLGAGGVAKAVVAALADAGADITIFNRTETRADALAQAFGCRHMPWDRRIQTGAALLVNCTSVGMWPDVDASPIPAAALEDGMTVFDAVYRPSPTRLLREASRRGCATIDGLTLFAFQARSQFRLWTGHALPAEAFRRAAEAGNID